MAVGSNHVIIKDDDRIPKLTGDLALNKIATQLCQRVKSLALHRRCWMTEGISPNKVLSLSHDEITEAL